MLDFDDLREELLRAGIAPRHVRRYLTELRHHYDDLIAEERTHGIRGPAVDEAASARLGSNDELAAALLAKPELRSVTARYPWLIFGILPPLAAIAGLLLLVLAMIRIGFASGVLPAHHQPVPAWFGWTVSGVMFAINFMIVPLLGAVLAWTAQRQRMKPLWPLLGMALILMLSIHGSFHVDRGKLFGDLGTIIPFKGPGGPGGTIHWPIFLAQGALLCLPLAWLWRARNKTPPVQ